jgi:uncharacterized BrkB/YihY/UPF0761 family membrane protein
MVERARKRFALADLAATVVLRPNYANDTLLASYIAIRLFVLIFPLMYVIVAGIGLYSRETSTTPHDAATSAGLHGAIANSVASAADSTTRGQVTIIIVGIILTAWAGRGALRSLRLAHAMVWHVPVPKTPLRELGGLAFALVIVGLTWLGAWTTRLRQSGGGIVISAMLMGAGVFVVWLLVSLRLPNAARRWFDLVPGALLAAIAVPCLDLAVQLYFAPQLSRTTATYGGLGVALVVLTYLLVLGWMTVLAAEFNAAVLEWRTRRQETA